MYMYMCMHMYIYIHTYTIYICVNHEGLLEMIAVFFDQAASAWLAQRLDADIGTITEDAEQSEGI